MPDETKKSDLPDEVSVKEGEVKKEEGVKTDLPAETEEPKEDITSEAPKEKAKAKEPKVEAPEEVEVPVKFKDIVEKVEALSVLELSELVKVLEKKFGVSAQAVAVATGPVAGGEGEEEKSSFNIELKSIGDQKIQVIKTLRDALGLGLKEAKELAESAPAVIKEGADKKTADELKAKLEEAGGTVELK